MEKPNKTPVLEVLKKHDRSILLAAGFVFLLAAVILTVREISLGFGYALLVITATSSIASLATRSAALRIAGLAVALAAALLGTGLYLNLLQHLPSSYLLSPAVLLVASSVWLVRIGLGGPRQEMDRATAALLRLAWVGFAYALVSVSWGFYYQFITHGLSPGFHLRRLLLTGFWVACGLSLYLGGRVKQDVCMLVSGAALTSLAVLKALLYDTSHLSGFDRVLAMAVMGVLLAGASLYLKTRTSGEAR